MSQVGTRFFTGFGMASPLARRSNVWFSAQRRPPETHPLLCRDLVLVPLI